MKKEKKVRLELVLIFYLIACNMLQILMIDAKGSLYDSIWKACILVFTIFSCVYISLKYKLKLNKNNTLIWLIFTMLTTISNICNGCLLANFSFNNFVTYIYPIISFFIFAVVFGNISFDEECLKNFLNYFIIFITYTCIFNMIYNYSSIINFINIKNSNEVQISSFFDNRNTFALYLLYGILSNIIIITYYKNKNKIYLFTLLLFALNAFLTLSRTNILCIAIFIFTLYLTSKDMRKNRKITLLICCGILVIICIPQFRNFISHNLIRKEAKLSNREVIWKYGINLYRENELTGIGMNNALNKLKDLSQYTSFHNTYLSILLDGGIVSAIGYMILFIYDLKKIIMIKKYNSELFRIFIAIFIVYTVNGITETNILFQTSATSFLCTTFVFILPVYITSFYYRKIEERNYINENQKN